MTRQPWRASVPEPQREAMSVLVDSHGESAVGTNHNPDPAPNPDAPETETR